VVQELGEDADLLSPLAQPASAPNTAPPPKRAPPKSPTSAEEHRSRLRQRLLAGGPDAVADHELLEMTLFLAILRQDTKPLAYRLLQRFGSYAATIAAPVHDLLAVDGIGESGAAALKIIHAAAVRLARAEIIDRPLLDNWAALTGYLNTVLSRERVEQFRILFLDTRNRLLADEPQSRGTVNHTPVYPREVAKRALELNATALILVHNHPSGDPTPSHDDIAITKQIDETLRAISVTLHDHLIVGNGTYVSLRGEGLF
jgi:DNA repair protein RadC